MHMMSCGKMFSHRCHGMTFSDLSFQDSPILLIILGLIPLLIHSLSHFRHKGSKAQRHSLDVDN